MTVPVVRLVLVSVTLLLLAACNQPTRSESTTGGPASEQPGNSTDCGTFILGQGEGLPGSAVSCFIDAVRAGHTADLKVTRPTIEGDPIPMSLHANSDGEILVINDSRQDRFGKQVVTRYVCTLDPSATAERASGWPEAMLTNCS